MRDFWSKFFCIMVRKIVKTNICYTLPVPVADIGFYCWQNPSITQKDEFFAYHFKLITSNIINKQERKYYEGIAISIFSPNLNVQKETYSMSFFE